MFKRFWRAVTPAVACLALAGCFLQPGKFNSALDLRKDGTFTFTYKGQIYMLALSKLAEEASKADASSEFVKQPCLNDDLKEHPCTAAEVAEQKRKWQEDKQQKPQQDEQNRAGDARDDGRNRPERSAGGHATGRAHAAAGRLAFGELPR